MEAVFARSPGASRVRPAGCGSRRSSGAAGDGRRQAHGLALEQIEQSAYEDDDLPAGPIDDWPREEMERQISAADRSVAPPGRLGGRSNDRCGTAPDQGEKPRVAVTASSSPRVDRAVGVRPSGVMYCLLPPPKLVYRRFQVMFEASTATGCARRRGSHDPRRKTAGRGAEGPE